MTISTIVLAITGAFGGGRGTGGSTPKDEGVLKKWLDRLADALKRPAGKAAEGLGLCQCLFYQAQLAHINEVDISFFMISLRS